MPSKGTPLRNVRVPDEVWTAAQRRAEDDGVSVSDVVRHALGRYAAGSVSSEVVPPEVFGPR